MKHFFYNNLVIHRVIIFLLWVFTKGFSYRQSKNGYFNYDLFKVSKNDYFN